MKLLHYSDEPLRQKINSVQIVDGDFKPRGLWVSVEGPDDWREWCEDASFGNPRYQTEIVLTGRGRPILRIGPSEIDAFTREYWRAGEDQFSYRSIDWTRLAGTFGGIIIAPYSWPHRLNRSTSWYYIWDCASGCLWDADAWDIGERLPVKFEHRESAS